MSNQLVTITHRYQGAQVNIDLHPWLDGDHVTVDYRGHYFSFINSKLAYIGDYAWECLYNGEVYRFFSQKETRDWLIEQLERIKNAEE